MDNGVLYKHGSAHPQQQSASHQEARGLDFDDYVRCALCGEVYPYDQLLNEHYPLFHPEVVGPDGVVELEEIPDEVFKFWNSVYNMYESKATLFRSKGYNYTSIY